MFASGDITWKTTIVNLVLKKVRHERTKDICYRPISTCLNFDLPVFQPSFVSLAYVLIPVSRSELMSLTLSKLSSCSSINHFDHAECNPCPLTTRLLLHHSDRRPEHPAPSVLNTAARLVFASRRTQHICPFLRDLHRCKFECALNTGWQS